MKCFGGVVAVSGILVKIDESENLEEVSRKVVWWIDG